MVKCRRDLKVAPTDFQGDRDIGECLLCLSAEIADTDRVSIFIDSHLSGDAHLNALAGGDMR